MAKTNKSNILFKRAQSIIPGGVNSPVRAFKSVNGTPRFFQKAAGARFYDVDRNSYIDYMMSWGPLILGHSHPRVTEAIIKAVESGTSFGASTEKEIILAEIVNERFPAAKMVRLVNSGTEATMTAIRLARAATGRDLLVKFDGCYHGHSDSLLVNAGSGVATGGIAGCAGITESTASNTISIPYNNIEKLDELFNLRGDKIAGVIIEPIAANMGLVFPNIEFLQKLRDLTNRYGAVLIFDEVISGFRVARGGACELLNITPDLLCFGKIIGGGLPIGALGGKKEIMQLLAPVGEVYQAGTLSGNPISVSAGIATLMELDELDFYAKLKKSTELLAQKLLGVFKKYNVPVTVNQVTGLLTVFFGNARITDFDAVNRCDFGRFSQFHQGLLEDGIYLPPSGYEAWFISSAHRLEEIEITVDKTEHVVSKMRN